MYCLAQQKCLSHYARYIVVKKTLLIPEYLWNHKLEQEEKQENG